MSLREDWLWENYLEFLEPHIYQFRTVCQREVYSVTIGWWEVETTYEELYQWVIGYDFMEIMPLVLAPWDQR